MKKIFCVMVSVLAFTFSSKDTMYSYVHKKLPTIHGWCSIEKSSAMMDLILNEKPDHCVEVGVFGGSSIFPTAMAMAEIGNGIVWAIDPWSTEECVKGMKGEEHRKWWSSFKMEDIYYGFQNLLATENLRGYCKTLRMTSKEALQHIPKRIDVLHIDGNHCEASSYFDVVNYLPRVKPGGYIWLDDVFWHDYPHKKHNTTKALAFALKHCTYVLNVDNGNCVLLKKN